MKIRKCSDFITEAAINRVLDKVIDQNGDLLNIKGYIIPGENKIKDKDNKEYLAGIDKNGKLFTFLPKDAHTNILYKNKPLKSEELNIAWNTTTDYADDTGLTGINLMSKVPTGWVNIKLDMEVTRKIKRLAVSLLNDISVTAFDEKLKLLSNPLLLKDPTLTNRDRFLVTESIQR